MIKTHKIAVIGATGNIGREVLGVLAENSVPQDQVIAIASAKSVGDEISYGEEKVLKVQNIDHFDFTRVGIVIFCTPQAVIEKYLSQVRSAGCLIVCPSIAEQFVDKKEYVVPEVNGALLQQSTAQIILTPDPGAIILSLVLQPFLKTGGIEQAVVTLLQAVSGHGREAMDELFNQTRGIYMNSVVQHQHFTKQIAFNLIPHIGSFDKDGRTSEETNTIQQTKQVLKSDFPLEITCVQAPVFIGYAATVTLNLAQHINSAQARKMLEQTLGVSVIDHRRDEGYVTPVETAGEQAVFVSRLRHREKQISFWVTADNLRRGAALNMAQIVALMQKASRVLESRSVH